MIIAYCDRCGHAIDANAPGGCRLVTGKTEISFHLCPEDQAALRDNIDEFLLAHKPRVVKA